MSKMRENTFFEATDTAGGFEPRGDGNDGITVKILSGGLDTKAKRSRRMIAGKRFTSSKAR